MGSITSIGRCSRSASQAVVAVLPVPVAPMSTTSWTPPVIRLLELGDGGGLVAGRLVVGDDLEGRHLALQLGQRSHVDPEYVATPDRTLVRQRRADYAGHMPSSDRRAARRQEILAATRRLFDERGVRDAQIEDIAQAVGINRAIIYRHFSGKEELFAMALVGYLDELDAELGTAGRSSDDPSERLVAIVHAFLDFGEQHPAFVDCALALLRRRGDELMDEVSEPVMFRLGRAMTACTPTSSACSRTAPSRACSTCRTPTWWRTSSTPRRWAC